MRIYLPATRSDLSAAEIASTRAHAVTVRLRSELDEDDEEILELVAFLAAADDSVGLIQDRQDRARRVVIAAEVPDALAVVAGGDDVETAVILGANAVWDDVVSIHVDEEEAEGTVAAAAAGDDAALEELGEQELLWYDVTEREQLADDLA